MSIWNMYFGAFESTTHPPKSDEYMKYIINKSIYYSKEINSIAGIAFDTGKLLAAWIKDNQTDKYSFIVTREQDKNFQRWIKDNELKDYIIYEQKEFIKNQNYMNESPRLKMYVLGPKGASL